MRSDDEVFVARCLEGDQPAFAFLVDKYKELVHAYAYRKVGDYQQAEDITQEVFTKAYKKLAQLKWPHKFRSWLYTIVSNECKLWLRRHSKEQEVSWEDVPSENLDELAVRNHSDEDIKLTVRSGMETLPDDRQIALSLFYMSSMSVREIAHFMGVSPNSVKIKLHRGRRQLGEELEKMIGKQLGREKLKSGFVFRFVDSIKDMPIPSLPKPRPIRWAPIPISIGLALLIGIIGYGFSSGKDVSSDMPILKPAETTFEVSLLPDPDGQMVLGAVSDKEFLDMGAEDIYQSDLASADAGDPQQTQSAAGTKPSGIVIRQVWEGELGHGEGSVSPDGRYYSDVHWKTGGNLAIRDFETGEKRDITDEGYAGEDPQFAGASIWSPDGKQIAYIWRKGPDRSLRIIGIDRAKPRVIWSSPAEPEVLVPMTWSRDGKYILALHWKGKSKTRDNVTRDIVLMSVADGSIRVLKSLGDYLFRMSLSPDGRYVAYRSPQNAGDISLLATDGSYETTLVKHPAYDGFPSWAPDGNRIVFVSDRSGTRGVWVLEVADGKPKGSPQLIKQNLNGMTPLGLTLTQNGSYYYELRSGGSDIYVATLDPETGEVVIPPAKAIQSFEGFNGHPAFSPDGKYLAYVSLRPKGTSLSLVLMIHSLETGEERALPPEYIRPGNPSWAPDGRSILVATAYPGDLHQINIETGEVTLVVPRNEQETIEGPPPVWSPDGSKIFFMRQRNGVNVIRAYDFKTKREWVPDFQLACEESYGEALALSPDGQQLAFMVSCDSEWSLQIAPSSGGEAHETARLRKEETAWGWGLTWTPDGRHLLFVGEPKDDKTGPGKLWRIPVEGGQPQNLGLTMKRYFRAYLSVHPDGRRIAFTGPGSGSGGVWAIENFLPGFTDSE